MISELNRCVCVACVEFTSEADHRCSWCRTQSLKEFAGKCSVEIDGEIYPMHIESISFESENDDVLFEEVTEDYWQCWCEDDESE